jgi:hypothetical protein
MLSRPGQLRLASAAVLLALAAAVIAVAEIGLRAWPGLLGPAFVNGVRSRYSARAGGIYYVDRRLGMHFMIPNHRTEMYYNGYAWTHESDALGFRNRTVSIPADIVLLGDSYIYGHGVDIDDTVGVWLERMTGLRVANLARQGDCAFQQAYLLTEYIGVFRPRHVVYFFYENDVADLSVFLDAAAMRAFVATPVEEIRYPPRTEPAVALREREARLRSWLGRARDSSYLLKAGRWLLWRLGVRPAQAAATDPDDPAGLAWRYTGKAIAYMQWLAARHGAELAIVPIVPTRPRYRDLLGELARDAGATLLDTAFLSAADPSLWLPGDGHFSATGARRTAALVAEHVGRAAGASSGFPREGGGPEGRRGLE